MTRGALPESVQSAATLRWACAPACFWAHPGGTAVQSYQTGDGSDPLPTRPRQAALEHPPPGAGLASTAKPGAPRSDINNPTENQHLSGRLRDRDGPTETRPPQSRVRTQEKCEPNMDRSLAHGRDQVCLASHPKAVVGPAPEEGGGRVTLHIRVPLMEHRPSGEPARGWRPRVRWRWRGFRGLGRRVCVPPWGQEGLQDGGWGRAADSTAGRSWPGWAWTQPWTQTQTGSRDPLYSGTGLRVEDTRVTTKRSCVPRLTWEETCYWNERTVMLQS